MWHTPEGDRVLRGFEGRLFQLGLRGLAEDLEQFGKDCPVGVEVYDRLSVAEQLASLEQVGRAMLIRKAPMLELNAVQEATAAAVYMRVLSGIEEEIQTGARLLRKAVRRAARETDLDDDLPKSACDDPEQWQGVIEALMERVFWDRDWEALIIDPDDPPALANRIREELGIPAEYYTAVPPDPAGRQEFVVRERLRALCLMQIT